MRSLRAGAALLAVLLGACAEVDLIGPEPGRDGDTFPGFDTSIYPGDAAMRAWIAPGSPYEWVGFYLPAPCHRDASWSGKRPTLQAMGWGTAVLYVGQQTWDGVQNLAPSWSLLGGEGPSVTCSRTLLTEAQGTLEGRDAANRTSAEGFPAGTVIFLDIERMETIPASMHAYFRAWIRGVLADGRFEPGVYAHLRNAAELHAAAREVYAAAGRSGAPAFWITGGSGFSLNRDPRDVGLEFASVWQGVLDVSETWGGTTLRIDRNVARRRSPSAPDG